MKTIFSLLVVLSGCFIISCQSGEPVYSSDMLPEDYFQKAQDRAEAGDYQTAVKIYYKMKETFPDNLEKNTWATYEIAFLQHKMGDDVKALQMIDELLSLYSQDKKNILPQGPKKLAEMVKDNIVNKEKYANKTASPNP